MIEDKNDQLSSYAVLLKYSDDYNFVLKDSIEYGQTVTYSLPAASDEFTQFWGVAGDIITIEVTPAVTGNALLMLYSQDMTLLVNETYSTGQGETRRIVDFELSETGFYSIRVGEFEYEATEYTLTLDK